ncbi:MAG: hypothetical protein AB7S99_05070 [Pseudodonghicola sp.]
MAAAAGRRPADAGKDNRQAVWDIMRSEHERGGAWLTLGAIVDRAEVHRKTGADYLGCLVAGGYAERGDDEVLGCAKWRLIKDGGHHAPRLRKDGSTVTQGAGLANIWRSMRMLRKFSTVDVALHSSTPATQVTESTVKSYCSMLLATGYLRVLQKADPVKGRKAIYQLVRNTGPKPPMIQRVKQVYDPNTGTVYRRGESE